MSRRQRKPCATCGGEKPAGPGRVYCDPCAALRYKCEKCGGPKPRAERKLCDPCNFEHMKQFAAMRRTPVQDAEPPGRRWCNRCQQHLPLRAFAASKGKRGGKAPYCKTCTSQYHWARRITRTYDITPEQYFEILALQGQGCAICSVRPKTRRLAVDHNHATGEVRGLLCTMCNHKVLGGAKERADILRRAAEYLESPPARAVLSSQSGTLDK